MPELEEQTEEQPVVQTAEELAAIAEAEKAEADANAELSAGFTGVDPTPTEETPLVEAEPVAEVVPVVPVVEPVLAKITEAQFQEVLAKANSVEDVRAAFAKYQRDAGGRIGGLEETIKQIKLAAQSGQSFDVTETDLEEVSKEYPDLAKAIAKDLAKVFGKAKAPATQTPVVETPADINAKVDARVNEGVAKVAQTLEERRNLEIIQEIAESHPDWETLTGVTNLHTAPFTPYRQWLHAQGTVFENMLLSSKSASTIVKSIDKFKAFEAAEKAKNPATPVTGKNARSERLIEAVPARGGGGSPPKPRQLTPEEEMAAGFANT
jgi:hypothetical protein